MQSEVGDRKPPMIFWTATADAGAGLRGKKDYVVVANNPVCLFEIYVEDMARAKRFYDGLLRSDSRS